MYKEWVNQKRETTSANSLFINGNFMTIRQTPNKKQLHSLSYSSF